MVPTSTPVSQQSAPPQTGEEPMVRHTVTDTRRAL